MHMLLVFVDLVVLVLYSHAFVSYNAFLLSFLANSNTRMLQRPTFSSSRGESQRIARVPNAPQMMMQKTAVTRASSAHLAYSGYWGSVLAYTWFTWSRGRFARVACTVACPHQNRQASQLRQTSK
jgi:hypothetical protein